MSGNSIKKKTKTEAEDEVEQLLRVAEDDVLLKLTLNSHLKSDYAINPDLDHRFQALKSRGTKNPNSDRKSMPPNSSSSSSGVDLPNQQAATTGDPDDLFARFAALKGTLPCYSSSSSAAATTTKTTTSSLNNQKSEEADDDEDEVDKIIRWAVDAARLDHSPCSDDDDDDDNDTDSDDDDDSLDSENRRQKIN